MREYKAFISYRHAPLDISVAVKLHRMIEHYRVPLEFAKGRPERRLGYVFRDQDELPVSSDLSANIQEALDHSQFLIVICTPETPKSMWVDREIRYFLKTHDRNHVLAVLADGSPQEAFPEPLIHLFDEVGNIVGDTEPLAANIADPASDRRRVLKRLDREALRVFAALLGCPYDALFQRERRYRARRTAAIGGVALAIALTYIALLLVKNHQITRQNAVLIEQKRQIQLNQSQLLAKDAAQALNDGDYVASMRAAVEALPRDAEDSRPYCPEAERALLGATNLFDTKVSLQTYQRLLDAVTVDMAAPVHDMAFSESGATLYTADDYGNLFAIDAFTGAVVWRTQVMENALDKPSALQLRLYEAQDCLLVSETASVACLNLKDGSERWRCRKGYTSIEMFALDAEHDRVATIVSSMARHSGDVFFRNYDLMVLRAGTGETLHRIRLLEDVSALTVTACVAYPPERVQNGLFFNDGKSFAGFYYAYIDEEIHYYVVDLESGVCRMLRTESSNYSTAAFHLDVTPDGKALAAFHRARDSKVAATVRLIGIEDGEIIAEGQTTEEEKAEFLDGEAVFHMLRGKRYAIFSVGNYMYVVNVQTAECLGGVRLYATPTSVQWLENGMFSITLENGYHAAAWLTGDNHFYDTQTFGFSFDIGANTRSAMGNLGFIRPHLVDSTIKGFECGTPDEGFGCIATVPKDASHRVSLVRLLPSLQLPQWQAMDLPGAGSSLEKLNSAPGLRLFGGKATAIESQRVDDKLQYRIAQIDLSTGAVERTEINRDGSMQYFWLFSDAKGAFDVVDYKGIIRRADIESGEQTDVTTENEVVLSSANGVDYVSNDAFAADCYLNSDGRLLTAWCDGAKLRWWLDGEAQSDVMLPEGLAWQAADGVKYHRLLVAAPDGRIILSDFGADPDCAHMTGFAAYDVFRNRWTRLNDLGMGSADRVFACADEKPRFAALDSDGALRVYDLETCQALWELPVNLPVSYVNHMRFILHDDFIILRMEDNRYAIYSVETGECVCRGALDLNHRSQTFAWLDGQGRRVVLIDAGTNAGILLDRESWMELARFSDAFAYDPDRDELYCLGQSEEYGRSVLQRRRIPDLWELIDIVNDSVGKE